MAHNKLGKIHHFPKIRRWNYSVIVQISSFQLSFVFLLTLFFMFCKDIVGTGRTMKVLLNNIEKYKPKMIKVAR